MRFVLLVLLLAGCRPAEERCYDFVIAERPRYEERARTCRAMGLEPVIEFRRCESLDEPRVVGCGVLRRE